MNRKKSGSLVTKTQTKPKRTRTTHKKSGGGVLPFSLSIPSRTAWIVALLLLAAFVFGIYYFFIGPAIYFLRMGINQKIQFRDSRILLSLSYLFLSFRNTSLGNCY